MGGVNEKLNGRMIFGRAEMQNTKLEQQEYLEFWAKLAHKAQETHQDFIKLTPVNQTRIASEVRAIIQTGSMTEVLRILGCLNP